MILNKLSKQIYEANKEKGFWDKERNVGELLMLVTSELGEAMEAHRKGNFTNPKGTFQKDTFEDEIADAIIRLLDMAGGLNIDIDFHVFAKLEYNKSRPKLHGKNY
jgi:NTP pyrophosphatase (non-canonical NTP hydrolase)